MMMNFKDWVPIIFIFCNSNSGNMATVQLKISLLSLFLSLCVWLMDIQKKCLDLFVSFVNPMNEEQAKERSTVLFFCLGG